MVWCVLRCVVPVLDIEPLVPIEPPVLAGLVAMPPVPVVPWPIEVPLVPGVLPGGFCVGDVVALGSIVGSVGPEPVFWPCSG